MAETATRKRESTSTHTVVKRWLPSYSKPDFLSSTSEKEVVEKHDLLSKTARLAEYRLLEDRLAKDDLSVLSALEVVNASTSIRWLSSACPVPPTDKCVAFCSNLPHLSEEEESYQKFEDLCAFHTTSPKPASAPHKYARKSSSRTRSSLAMSSTLVYYTAFRRTLARRPNDKKPSLKVTARAATGKTQQGDWPNFRPSEDSIKSFPGLRVGLRPIVVHLKPISPVEPTSSEEKSRRLPAQIASTSPATAFRPYKYAVPYPLQSMRTSRANSDGAEAATASETTKPSPFLEVTEIIDDYTDSHSFGTRKCTLDVDQPTTPALGDRLLARTDQVNIKDYSLHVGEQRDVQKGEISPHLLNTLFYGTTSADYSQISVSLPSGDHAARPDFNSLTVHPNLATCDQRLFLDEVFQDHTRGVQLPAILPFQPLETFIKASPIIHSYVEDPDNHTDLCNTAYYLQPGRRGFWTIPLGNPDPAQYPTKEVPSCGRIYAESGRSSMNPSEHESVSHIVWTLRRFRSLIVEVNQASLNGTLGLLDFQTTTSEASRWSKKAKQKPDFEIRISCASTVALRLRTLIGEWACNLNELAENSTHFSREDNRALTTSENGARPKPRRNWLHSDNGIRLAWWDLEERRPIFLA